jgi:GNAT superfamily N-acetyltransferase
MQTIQAGVEHVPQAAPLFDAYRQFYRQPSDLAGAAAFLRERIERNESIVFLAVLDGAVVGFTQLYPCFSSTSMKRLWILNDLFVVPEARRRGVAQALMERTRQLALQTSAEGLALETAVDNHNAQKLYEQLGWIRDEEFFRYSLRVP